MVTLKPSQLRQLLVRTIPAHEPVLITGAPGIGKSDIIMQACAEAGADLVVMHPVVSDPTDFKGMPWVSDGGASFLPFGELLLLINAIKLTVCFVDDLGQSPPAVQAALMQLILARRVNGHKISEHVVFIAATNRRSDRAGVTGLLEPVKSRFLTIVELKADFADWRAWALGAGVAIEVVGFLNHRPELLSAFVASADLTNSPSPRTWHAVSRALALNLPNDLQVPVIEGAVGHAAAIEFVAFLRVWKSLVSPDLVLAAPDTAPIPSEPSALYALATALADKVRAASMGRYVRYLDRLIADGKREFAAVSIKTATARPDAIALTNTPDYIRASAGEIGKLLIGE